MTRENKLVMVIGFGFLLFLGILVSDHLAASSTPINRDVVGTGFRPVDPVGLPGFPEPFPAPEPARTELAQGGGAPIVQPPLIGLDEVGARVNGIAPSDATKKERVHKVAKGEHPGDIARKYYGKRSLGEKLASYNGIDPSRLRIGQELRIPDVAVLDPALAPAPAVEPGADAVVFDDPGMHAGLLDPAPAPAPAEEARVRTVKVREGDTLYKIAKDVLGDGSLWERIARENQLGNGRTLKPGMVLSIRLEP